LSGFGNGGITVTGIFLETALAQRVIPQQNWSRLALIPSNKINETT
jgi:hypothetical protein